MLYEIVNVSIFYLQVHGFEPRDCLTMLSRKKASIRNLCAENLEQGNYLIQKQCIHSLKTAYLPSNLAMIVSGKSSSIYQKYHESGKDLLTQPYSINYCRNL